MANKKNQKKTNNKTKDKLVDKVSKETKVEAKDLERLPVEAIKKLDELTPDQDPPSDDEDDIYGDSDNSGPDAGGTEDSADTDDVVEDDIDIFADADPAEEAEVTEDEQPEEEESEESEETETPDPSQEEVVVASSEDNLEGNVEDTPSARVHFPNGSSIHIGEKPEKEKQLVGLHPITREPVYM